MTVLKDIKKELLKSPQSIINILEEYEFSKIHIQNSEIRFAIAEGHNSSAIRIKLVNNDNLYVDDFVRNICNDYGSRCDLISYIIKTKNTDFLSVLTSIKKELGIADFCDFHAKQSVFGGFYDRIKTRQSDLNVRVHSEKILDNYLDVYSDRFAKDNISFSAQEKFQIGYDVDSQRITIPVRNAYGELIGIKGRATWNVADDDCKYLYIVPCPMSSTLFGYCQNYEFLNQADEILVGESEKFVMQCYSYDIHNCVALGSNSLSTTQARLLVELNPKKIIFMLDKGLDFANTKANVEKLKQFTRMFDIQIYWWDWHINTNLPDKASPSDFGKSVLVDIIKNEIKEVSV